MVYFFAVGFIIPPAGGGCGAAIHAVGKDTACFQLKSNLYQNLQQAVTHIKSLVFRMSDS